MTADRHATSSQPVREARDAIVAYIRAKDANRPYLMRYAFDEAATLDMVVKTEAIAFPPNAAGREALTDVLVREFGRTYENVHTFCLSSPPREPCTKFSCPWLVAMSAKEGRTARVGCGRYDWTFGARHPQLVEKLTITIEAMLVLPPDSLPAVMAWVEQLPYPWCPGEIAAGSAPALGGLAPISAWLCGRGKP